MNAHKTSSVTNAGFWPRRLRGKLTILFLLSPSLAIGLVAAYAALSYRQAQREALLEEARTILALLVQHHPQAMGGTGGRIGRINLWTARVAELPKRHPRVTYVMLRDS